MLILFSNVGCSRCETAKKMLEQNEIEFKEIKLNEMPMKMEYELLNDQIYIMSVPVLVSFEEGHYKVINVSDAIKAGKK